MPAMERRLSADRSAHERGAEDGAARRGPARVIDRPGDGEARLPPWDRGTRLWDDEVRALDVRGSTERRSVSMACLGRTGQWGNALMAYFFLRAFAAFTA